MITQRHPFLPWFPWIGIIEEGMRHAQKYWTGHMGDAAHDLIAPYFRNTREPIPFAALKIGASASTDIKMTKRDDYYFASCSDSWDTSQDDPTRGRVPGLLAAAAIPKVTNELLGPGWIIRDMKLRFGATAYIGDVMRTYVEISAKIAGDEEVGLGARICNQNGEMIVEGILSVKR